MKKKLLRIGIAVVISLLAVFALLHTPLVQKQVRKYAVSQLEKKFGLMVSVRDLDYNLFSLRITLHGVTIKSRNYPHLPPFLEADTIQVKIPLSLLTKGKLELKEFFASGLHLSVYEDKDNITNIPDFSPASEKREKKPTIQILPDFEVEKMILSRASILYEDHRNEFSFEMPVIDASLEWIQDSTHTFRIYSLQGGTVTYGGQANLIQALSAEGALSNAFLEIQDFELELLQNRIQLSGMIDNLLSPSLNLRADADIRLESLGFLFPGFADLSGRMRARSWLEGSLSSFQAGMHIQGQNMRVGQIKDAGIEADIHWKEQLLSVDSFWIEATGGKITGGGEFHPLDWEKGNRARLHLQDLDLSELTSLFAGIPPFSSRISGNIEAAWNEPTLAGLTGTAELNFQRREFSNFKGSGFPFLSGRLDVDAAPKQVSISIPGIFTENAALSGKIQVKGRDLSGQYRLEAKDLRSIASRYFASQILERVPDFGGEMTISGRFDGTTKDPRVSSKWEGNGISFGGLSGLDLEGETRWERQSLSIQYFRLTSGVASVNFSGVYPFRPKAVEPSIEFSLSGIPMELLSSFFVTKKEIAGEIELNGKTQKIQPFPQVSGQGKLSGLQYSGWKADEVLFEYTIKERSLNLDISADSPPLFLHGTIGLDSPFPFEANLEMKGALLSEILPSMIGIPGADASGRLTSRIDFRGDVKNLERMEISGKAGVDASHLILNKPPLEFQDIRLELSLENKAIEISPSSFRLKKALLELEGRIPLSLFLERFFPERGESEVSGQVAVRITNLDPLMLISTFSEEPLPNFSGLIDGNIDLMFSALDLYSLNASAKIETFDLNLWGVPLKLDRPQSLRWQAGMLYVDNMDFSGAEKSFRLKGILDFNRKVFRSFSIEGNIDLKMFQSFSDRASYSGISQFKASLEGPFINPSITGTMDLQDVQAELSDPDLYMTHLSGKIRFSGEEIAIADLEGSLNGGKIKLNGAVIHKKFMISKAALNFSADEINMDYPPGLRSLIKVQLDFESDGVRHTLGGSVSLLAAEYREPFNLESRLFQLLRTKGKGGILLERNAFLNDLNFNIKIDTLNPAEIDNNLAKATARASLKLTGSPYDLGLSGRIEFDEGGEVYLAKNTYQIEQATVDFINPSQILPDIGLRAQTRTSGYLIQLLVFGTPDDLSARLVSDPPLAESDIVSLLLTGRRLEYVSSSLLNVVGHQALDYIENAALGQVEQIAEKTLGLDSVRIDTSLIAPQENPEARITIGQQIASDLELIFSQGLRETDERTIILDYNPVRNLNLRGIKQDNNAYQFSTTHELRFGLKKQELIGPAYSIEKKGPPIKDIEFQGRMGLSRKSIAKQLKLKPGKHFDFFVLQRGLERIKKLYLKNNYLEFELDYEKKEVEDKVTLILHISAGPKVFLRLRGAEISSSTLSEAERLWMEGSFQKKRVEDVRMLIRKKLFERGYYQTKIEVQEELISPEVKAIYILVSPGIKYARIAYHFEGRHGLSEKKLLSILKKPDSVYSLFEDPGDLISELEVVYRRSGYLKAKVENPRIDFRTDEKAVDVTFSFQEGPLFLIDLIEFNGRSSIDRDTLLKAAGISAGETLTPELLYRSQSNLENLYSRKGFLNARIQSRVAIDHEEGKIDLIFDIEENKKAIIEEIGIFGNTITKPGVVKRELNFKEGQAVDYRKFSAAQKKLYGLGIFSSISIDSHPLAEMQGQKESSTIEEAYRVEILLEEMKPYYLRYGAQYNTETGIGGEINLVRRNFLGRAMDLGGDIQADLREQDARAYFRNPYFLGKRMDTSLFAFANRKEEPDFTTSRTGATLQQQLTIRSEFVISYNYTFQHLRNLAGEMPIPEERYNIGRISFSLSRDKRKNIFDSLQGSFISLTGEYAEKFLASDVRYLRFFGQYFLYLPLGQFLTYASALRIGLGQGLGQELVPSERFFAGGSSSLRGFGYHEVGPKNPLTGNPEGGNAVFVLTQELRFPVYRVLSGAAFLDVGNVYATVSAFDPLDIRKTAGFGLRLNLGFALARLDFAFKLDRRSGESLFRLHFGLGQAF
jgi:outer membrane protein assembly complex protein YaeT